MAANLNTGFTAKQRADIVAGLNKVLADSYALYLKTHGYHWNVRGPNFQRCTCCWKVSTPRSGRRWTPSPSAFAPLGELAPMGYARLRQPLQHQGR
jgi:starvation-inducible DNA-binding protein